MRPRFRSVAFAAAAFLVVACSGDDDPAATDLGQDAVGWCLDIADDVGAEITDLPRVNCGEPHTHEVFAIVDWNTAASREELGVSDTGAYPGFEALESVAQVECLKEFEPYVGISPFDSNLFYSWMVPTLASWEDTDIGNRGDREIICVVGSADGAGLTESVRGSAR
jgi:hypothetical protein